MPCTSLVGEDFTAFGLQNNQWRSKGLHQAVWEREDRPPGPRVNRITVGWTTIPQINVFFGVRIFPLQHLWLKCIIWSDYKLAASNLVSYLKSNLWFLVFRGLGHVPPFSFWPNHIISFAFSFPFAFLHYLLSQIPLILSPFQLSASLVGHFFSF